MSDLKSAQVKLLIFDLDGTLFHTAPGIYAAACQLLAQRGYPAVDYDTVVSYIGMGLANFLHRLDPAVAQDQKKQQEFITDFRKIYDNHFLHPDGYKLMDGVVDFLKQWPHQLAVVSNKTEYYVKRMILETELAQFSWTTIAGGDTFATKKPHPLPLLQTMNQAKVTPAETIMIGDGEPDIEGAAKAGIRSIAVDFGYAPIAKLLSLGANYRLSRYSDLADLVRRL